MAQAIITTLVTPLGSITPAFEGQKVIDTVADIVYIAFGLTNADWQEVGSGGGSNNVIKFGQPTLGPATWDLSTDKNYHLRAVDTNTSININVPNELLPNLSSNLPLSDGVMLKGQLHLYFGLAKTITINATGFSTALNFVDHVSTETSVTTGSTMSITSSNELVVLDVDITPKGILSPSSASQTFISLKARFPVTVITFN